MATQLLANVEENRTRKRVGILLDLEGERAHQICSFMWADNFWIMSHSQSNLEQMLRDLIEEAEKWDLAPKPASLWWTSTFETEEKADLSIDTKSGSHRFPIEEKFKFLGMNRQGKAHDAIEESLQSANEAWWRDVNIYRSKDVLWRIKCRRMVEQFYRVFSFGSENWSWTQKTQERVKGWETNTMIRPFRFIRDPKR